MAVHLSKSTRLLLNLVAAHDGRNPGDELAHLICARAEKIGLRRLAKKPPLPPPNEGRT